MLDELLLLMLAKELLLLLLVLEELFDGLEDELEKLDELPPSMLEELLLMHSLSNDSAACMASSAEANAHAAALALSYALLAFVFD